jgi:hypothetical protein
VTIKEALRRGMNTVFCVRCQWKQHDCAPSLVKGKCPSCHEYALDSAEPKGMVHA